MSPEIAEKEGNRAFRVADEERLERILDELARRLHARASGPVRLVGIQRRGVPLAEGIASRLHGLGREVTVDEVGLKRYDDDLTVLHDEPRLDETPLSFDPEGARIVLVDDVLFTGRTLFRAVAHFVRKGAECVDAMVVCARDEPELPVSVRYVGMHLDVGSDGIVEVEVPPYESEAGVWLRHRPGDEGVRNGPKEES